MPSAFPSLLLTRGSSQLWLTQANGWYVLRGIEGLDTPPVSLLMDDPATWDGSIYRDVRYNARDVFLPMHLQAADTDAMRTQIKTLVSFTDPKRGAVTLSVQQYDGATRSIDGYLSMPLGNATVAGEGFNWRRFGLTLRCPDPFWYSTVATQTFNVSTSTAGFLSSTFLPMQVSNSQVSGTVTVTNNGDADAYPVWTITGPSTSITVTVQGRTWTVPSSLGAAETLIVDTRRGQQSATVNGQLAWGRLGPGADLSPFPPGATTVTFDVIGATSATKVTMDWTERWLTAW